MVIPSTVAAHLTPAGPGRRRGAAVVAMLACLLPLTACTPATSEPATDTSPQAPADPAPAARVLATVPLAGDHVRFAQKIGLRTVAGTLTSVTLVTSAGAVVPGRSTGHTWTTRDTLLPDTRYTLTAVATNADGLTTDYRRTFHTRPPALTDFPAVTPLTGSVVGIGHPVVIYLDHDVTDRAAVERRLHVQTSRPTVGSWGWIDARTVAYRPRTFWPANTDVTVRLDLARTRTAPGTWVMVDRTIRFRVGRSQVLRIDNHTHQMSVVRAGHLVRTIPVSMGKPGYTTRSGVKVIMGRERVRRMDSTTVAIGGSEAYDLDVPYAMRLTATGEFIHGAPWSEWAQGSLNVSHGCTNVSLADAHWLYDHVLIGDPVTTVGTGRPTEEWNGLGGIYNFSWAQWTDRSALS